MFGIEDPGIYLAYVGAVACLVFALWFGFTRWHRETEEGDNDNENPEKR